jgi:hypothetical protein
MWRRSVSLLLALSVLELSSLAQRAANPRQGLLIDPQWEQPEQPRFGVAMTDEMFARWLFGRIGGIDRARTRLEARLAWEIQRIDRIYGLGPEQKHKLEVAGRGDIKRFFDDLQKKKELLDRAGEDRLHFLAIFEELEALRHDAHEILFIDGSLFAKTLKNTLSPAQSAQYKQDRLDFYRTRVAWAVWFLGQRLRLSQDQRERFVALIVAESRPLRRYGPGDFSAILVQASRLPEAKLRPILDETQWLLLGRQFQEVQGMERILVAEGYLPDNVRQ